MPRTPKDLKGKLWGRATSAAGVTTPCHWCGVAMTWEAATVDHEPPLAEGGRSRRAVLACDPCNQRRGAATNARINEKRKAKRKAKKRKKPRR